MEYRNGRPINKEVTLTGEHRAYETPRTTIWWLGPDPREKLSKRGIESVRDMSHTSIRAVLGDTEGERSSWRSEFSWRMWFMYFGEMPVLTQYHEALQIPVVEFDD